MHMNLRLIVWRRDTPGGVGGEGGLSGGWWMWLAGDEKEDAILTNLYEESQHILLSNNHTRISCKEY